MNSASICIDVHCIWYGQHTATVCCTGSTANRAAMKPTEPPLAHAALIRTDPRAPTDDTLAGRVVVFSVGSDCILRMVGITRLSVATSRRHRGGSSRGGNNIKTGKWRLDLASVSGCNCGCTLDAIWMQFRRTLEAIWTQFRRNLDEKVSILTHFGRKSRQFDAFWTNKSPF